MAVTVSCVSPPAVPAHGKGTVWGYVELVPRSGVTPRSGDAAGYADPALRDVRFVDYSRPGFSVVYLESPPVSDDAVALAIRESVSRLRIEPATAAVSVAGHIAIANETTRAQVVSDPQAGRVYRLDPGQKVRVEHPDEGPHAFHLLGSPGVEARVFVAPGPYSLVSPRGRFELSDIEPGTGTIHAWHPRFPSFETEIDVAAGARVRVDVALGLKAEFGEER